MNKAMNRGLITTIAAILSIGLSWTPVHAAGETVGRFIDLRGRVDVTRPGAPAVPATLDFGLRVGDIVRTKSRSGADIQFIDESVVRMNDSARMEITEFSFEKKRKRSLFSLFRGKIQNWVSDRDDGGRGPSEGNRYEVRTPTAVIGVRGTRFVASYEGVASEALFLEGEGYCYAIDQPDLIETISAGQLMRVDHPTLPPVIRPATPLEMERHMKESPPGRRPDGKDGPPKPGDAGSVAQKAGGPPGAPPLAAPAPPPEARRAMAAVEGMVHDLMPGGGDAKPGDPAPGPAPAPPEASPDTWIRMEDALARIDMGAAPGSDGPAPQRTPAPETAPDMMGDIVGIGGAPEPPPQPPREPIFDPTDPGVPDMPAIEIGRVDLTGVSDIMSVRMNDVIFFSSTTGGAPSIWETNSVSGEFSAAPASGHTVSLSGDGIAADFRVGAWAAGAWSAGVDGSGDLTRTDAPGKTAVRFSGDAGGIYTGDAAGTFSGAGGGTAE